MKRVHWLSVLWAVLSIQWPGFAAGVVEIPADVLADKIGGGLLGQILGNLNGLPHENRYIASPGHVSTYTPALPDGAWTDDDTDIEWIYITEMQRTEKALVPAERIVELWRKHINRRIWSANLYARGLMDLGLEPPLTGSSVLNPWSEFNVGGQFLCECFGLVAPAMPQTASRIGLHYTHVAIDGEPAQATQFFTSMIATAFVESDIPTLVTSALAAVDPRSDVRQLVSDVLEWWKTAPGDWRGTRDKIHAKYTRHQDGLRDRNGYALNAAAVVGSLLHGKGDFVETLRLAFSFGWDADCNAATAGTVVGVIKGRQWMHEQKWAIGDRYENRTRPGMPTDETITRFTQRLVEVAGNVIVAGGGSVADVGGRRLLRIAPQTAASIEPLVAPDQQLARLRRELLPRVEQDLAGGPEVRARAAYVALCLGEAERLTRTRPEDWKRAIEALNALPEVARNIARAPSPSPLAAWAKALGLQTRPSN